MKVIFLDFDGVLNNEPFLRRNTGSFDPKNIAALNSILDAVPSATLIVSSNWRHSRTIAGLAQRLENEGVRPRRVEGLTPDLDRPISGSSLYVGTPRGAEIKAWLDAHPEVDAYVILDDDTDMDGTHPGNFIHTSMARGLTHDQAQEAVDILNMWDDR